MCEKLSVVVRNARDHFIVPTIVDVQMANFAVLNTLTFASLDAKDFHYIGVISEVMLKEVPTDNEVVTIYMKIPKPGPRYMSPTMQAALEFGVVTRTGGKRRGKAVEEGVSRKPSK